jgi:hypothetical protein
MTPCDCAKGVIGGIKSVLHLDAAPAEVIAARRDQCRVCPHATLRQGKMVSISRCQQCGCFIALKTRLKSEKCPQSRW